MSEQTEHRNNGNLKASRAGSLKNSLKSAKKNIAAAKNAASLMSYGEMIDLFLVLALAAAMLKDIMDLFGNSLLIFGGFGQAIITISTFMASATIGFAIFATNSSSKLKTAKRLVKKNKSAIYQKLISLGGATVIELIPGIDFLPLESITVCYIIYLTLRQRRRDAENERREKEQAQAEMRQNLHTMPQPEQQAA